MSFLKRLLGQSEPQDESPYAEPDEYAEMPILSIRPWDYGQGQNPENEGYGFETPDGKIWPAKNCTLNRWNELGVVLVNVVGTKYHLEDLQDDGFRPGQPIKLIAEPDNPNGSGKAIAIRDWSEEMTAGYVKSGNTSRLRNLLRDQEIKAMAMSCRYSEEHARQRETLKVVVFRSNRVNGADHIPSHPPIAEAVKPN